MSVSVHRTGTSSYLMTNFCWRKARVVLSVVIAKGESCFLPLINTNRGHICMREDLRKKTGSRHGVIASCGLGIDCIQTMTHTHIL